MNSVNQNLSGYYRVAVVDTSGNILWEQPEFNKNLILNTGMDMIYTYYFQECMTYAVAGTGTRNNSITSAGSTITQVGTTITLTPTGSGTGLNQLTQSAGGYLSAVSVGDIIKYSSGTEVMVISGLTDLTAVVSPSVSITNEEFTIWKTSQTSLQTEVKRAGAGIAGSYYLTGAGNCGSSLNGNVITHLRTYDFPVETGNVTYTEIGTSYSSTIGAPSSTFNRIILPSPVVVGSSQRLRVIYQLNVEIHPTASISRPNVTVTNWPVSPSTNTHASESIQTVQYSYIDVNSGVGGGYGPLEPSSQGANACQFFISNCTGSVYPFNSAVNRGSPWTYALASSTKSPYVNGTYYCDKSATFDLTQMNRTDIRSIGFGQNQFSTPPIDPAYQAYVLVFDQNQTKTNIQTLTLAWRFTWGRTIA